MANRPVGARKDRNVATVRASISFAEDHYQALEDIALEQHVSLGWVVREAVEHYIATSKKGKDDKRRPSQD